MKRYKPASRALPRHILRESSMDSFALGLGDLLGGPYARFVLKVRSIEFRHAERLLGAWRDHMEGRARLVLAFRHPYGEEPQILSRAFGTLLPRIARRAGKPLPAPARARFVHGYEVPLWSDALTRWILPRSGAVPVYHAKLDKPSVERMRSILRNGPYPLALAPEGQVSYRAERLPRLERGALRLGFWCAEELRAEGRSERALIVPISVHFRFDERRIGALESLVGRLESILALPRGASARGLDREDRRAALLARLDAIDLALIASAEEYYRAGPLRGSSSASSRAGPGESRDERLGRLLETALERAEGVFGLRPEGDTIARVYRIRQEGWDRIYPEAGPGKESGTARPGSLARLLEDRKAGEAWYAMRHMEFVDLCYYLDWAYPRGGAEGRGTEGLSFDRLVEYAYGAADLASRLAGGNIRNRPSVLSRRAIVSVSPPLDLTERMPAYEEDKRRALDGALADLERSYLDDIKERIDERRDRNGDGR